MIELEKLYDCADRHLSKEVQDWDRFASDFGAIFGSKMALYRPGNVAAGLDFLSMDELIATTDREIMIEFFEKKIIKYGRMFDDAGNPLEPFRRTDVLNDDEYRSSEVTKAFLQPNDVFFLMIVYAVLPDDSLLVLYLWRGENQQDYSDIEKQRIALFMRYLRVLVRKLNPASAQPPNRQLLDFGEKYSLTKSEIIVLSKLLEGHSLKSISQDIDRSYGTVRWHVQNILEKCQVKSQKNLLGEFYGLIKS